MLDFLSCAYLGLRHASSELSGWPALTTGRPAALGGAALADLAARELAHLQGMEDGIAAASTLHLAVDIFTLGLPSDAELHWDGTCILSGALRSIWLAARRVCSCHLTTRMPWPDAWWSAVGGRFL